MGPKDVIAAVHSILVLDADSTLGAGQLTSNTINAPSVAARANDASSQDTASRSITPIPPRTTSSADDGLLDRARGDILRAVNRACLIPMLRNTGSKVRVICIATLPGSQGVVTDLRPDATNLEWKFLSNHAYVLICIAEEPEIRLREVATRVGITERPCSGLSPTSKRRATYRASARVAAIITSSARTDRSATLSSRTAT
jgi:hypothetical protein